ncbi:MAG: hypothetical protein EHM58_11650 [Ignavibacteriae bacterium]|nr:MAG: hypothetical protein EHM58_11650 [Ignavibacteriota bacterium]
MNPEGVILLQQKNYERFSKPDDVCPHRGLRTGHLLESKDNTCLFHSSNFPLYFFICKMDLTLPLIRLEIELFFSF